MKSRINRNLKAMIYRRYDSLADFAAVMNVDRSYVTRLVRGYYASPEQMRRIAEILKCAPEDIFGDYEPETVCSQ